MKECWCNIVLRNSAEFRKHEDWEKALRLGKVIVNSWEICYSGKDGHLIESLKVTG